MMSLMFSIPCAIFFAARFVLFKTTFDLVFCFSFLFVMLIDVLFGSRRFARILCGAISLSMSVCSLAIFCINTAFDLSYLALSALWHVVFLLPLFSDTTCILEN